MLLSLIGFNCTRPRGSALNYTIMTVLKLIILYNRDMTLAVTMYLHIRIVLL